MVHSAPARYNRTDEDRRARNDRRPGSVRDVSECDESDFNGSEERAAAQSVQEVEAKKQSPHGKKENEQRLSHSVVVPIDRAGRCYSAAAGVFKEEI